MFLLRVAIRPENGVVGVQKEATNAYTARNFGEASVALSILFRLEFVFIVSLLTLSSRMETRRAE